MQHWYVYHSTEAMGRDYASSGESAVYSAKGRPKLCFGDMIWVIEGSTGMCKDFKLVDRFVNEQQDHGSFVKNGRPFKLKISGKSLLPAPIRLNGTNNAAFDDIYKNMITKQKFFNLIPEAQALALLT
ncbi:MAG: hypothetical protein CTY38_00990 [Methylotenera sp.]|uniref:hypothetical protein n=1 Tax=Methylotenera sp. TaxID=2051956 RepID=UPI000D469EFB|nr:hypothetical protein [Methylotenera sp.]PPC84654.1 MAG: hypothetical protein CTY38_00990 [Methylotenera sp.]